MSSSSSYRSVDSEDDTTSWLVSSEDSIDDEDELTLLNGDEENDENSTTFEAFIRLSMRLKKQYNLREASVSLERCDKIWDTMQLLKSAQSAFKVEEEVDETDEENNRSKSCGSDSISSSVSTGAIPYIKYQPTQGNGNNALPNFYLSVKKQTKIYNCGTCGKIYNEKRALKIHMKRDHGIALSGSPQNRKRSNNSETRPKTPQTTDTSSVDGDKTSRSGFLKTQYPCPVCGNLYAYMRSLRTHAQNVHGVDVPMDSIGKLKNEEQTKKSEASTASRKVTSMNNENKRATKTDPTDISYVYTYAVINNCKSYRYFCIICHKQCHQKRELRSHMRVRHEIDVPKGPEGTLYGLFIKDVDTTREYLRRLQQNEAIDENSSQLQTQRADPKSSRTLDRPKRACTANTSYEEQSKEEEEFWRHDQVSSKSSSQSPSSGQTTKCFLCKRSCVDMIRHLRDYHRISKPDSVLPLNEHVSNNPISEENYVKVERIETKESEEEKESSNQKKITSELKSPSQKKSNGTIPPQILPLLNAQIEGLYRKTSKNRKDRKTFQCLMCMAKYSHLWSLKCHLSTKMKDGVVQMHESSRRLFKSPLSKNRIQEKEETAQDPLKLDDTSTIDSESSSVKRRSSCSDESSSTSEVIPSKRKKIEFAKDIDKSSDTGSDESEVETTSRKSKKNSRYNRDEEKTGDRGEDKSPGQRDTRDSSDRDSGIGISITIKKRNNSYEVVEKDNYCEEAQAVESRPRAISDALDCPEERSSNKSTTISTRDQEDDDVTIVECTDSTFMRTIEQMSRQENVRSSHKASRKIPGKVSLKVLCRNLLKRHRVSRFTKNHVNSHQCPVCCRFYATERDVTVHMIDHKMSKTTFRCAGMFGIPRSSLRRYGKRKTLPVIQDAWR